MDRLDIAIALLQEAKEEKERINQYKKAEAELPGYGEPGYDDIDWPEFYRKWTPLPKKSVVNDNIKVTRRLLLSERM